MCSSDLHARWSRLTRKDLARIAGNRERLVAKLRERYALDEAQALQQLAAWQTALQRVSPFS